MLQESVYCKLILSATSKPLIMNKLNKIKPSIGNVFVLTITEKQFSNMDYLLGEKPNAQIDSVERVVVL